MRRTSGFYRFPPFKFDARSCALMKGEQVLSLRRQSCEILSLLLSRAGETVTRGEIAQRLWDRQPIDVDDRINAAMRDLRKALGDTTTDPRFIVTVPRKGYYFLRERLADTNRYWGYAAAAALGILAVGVVIAMSGTRDDPHPVARAETPAQRLCLEAQGLLADNSEGAADRAQALLEQAVAAEPTLSSAWESLADVWYGKQILPEMRMPTSRRAALSALEADPNSVAAHLRLADLAVVWDRNWDEADAYLKRALQLDPGNSKVHHTYASFLFLTGQIEQGLEHMERGLTIDPLSFMLNVDLAWFLTVSGRYEQALDQCEKIRELVPDSQMAIHCPLEPHLLSGNLEAAQAIARQVLELAGASVPDLKAPASETLRTLWELRLQRLVAASEEAYVDPINFARAYAQLGQPAKAIEWIERAVEIRSEFAPYLHLFPEFRSLHAQPRFLAALEQVGLAGRTRSTLVKVRSQAG